MVIKTALRSTLMLALAATFPTFCLSANGQSSKTPAAATAKISPIPGFDTSIMDTKADPCADFYQFACGKFAEKYPIPGDLPLYDQFENLNEYNRQLLHGILEQASKQTSGRSSGEQKIGDYYASCMNTNAIDADGLKPLQAELDRINALKDKKELPALLAHYQKISVNAFFELGSMQDFKDATKEIASVDQGGLGLPEKDYYLRDDPKSVQLRQEYLQHITNMLHLYGEPTDKAMTDAKAILALEASMAKASMGMTERRDPYKTYHIETVATLAGTDPGLDWQALLRDAGTPPIFSRSTAFWNRPTWQPSGIICGYICWTHLRRGCRPRSMTKISTSSVEHWLASRKCLFAGNAVFLQPMQPWARR
jgi:putative endopeptidase